MQTASPARNMTHDELQARVTQEFKHDFKTEIEVPLLFGDRFVYIDVLVHKSKERPWLIEVKTCKEHNRIGTGLRELHMQGEWLMRERGAAEVLRVLWLESPVLPHEMQLLRCCTFELVVFADDGVDSVELDVYA